MPEISKELILGVDFLFAFGYCLTRKPKGEQPNQPKHPFEIPTNNANLCFNEDYFDLNSKIFQMTVSPRCTKVETQSNEEDESLNIPTIEIPDERIETPEDIRTEHILSPTERQSLFVAILDFPITTDDRLGRTHV